MDGKSLVSGLQDLLNEDGSSSFLSKRISYEWLWKGACEFVSRTNSMKSKLTVTTQANQANYDLTTDFLKLYLMDTTDNFILGYTSFGQSQSFLSWQQYDEIVWRNTSPAAPRPTWWTVIDSDTVYPIIQSTATAGSVSLGGSCILTDSTAPFTNVSAGDRVHNTTDGSDGIVLSVQSTTQITVALFDGVSNIFNLNDAYVITSQGRVRLVLSPACQNSGDTATLDYIQRPAPVFSDYGTYRFQPQQVDAIIYFAAWAYKYRDREKNTADSLYKYFELEVSRAISMNKSSINKRDPRISFRKRSGRTL